jgi:hypothetical protein
MGGFCASDGIEYCNERISRWTLICEEASEKIGRVWAQLDVVFLPCSLTFLPFCGGVYGHLRLKF